MNNRLPEYQSGFRPKFSAETAILRFSSDVFERLSKREVSLALSLDLSKAFDTVSHSILLAKLDHHGIRGQCLSWFQSYLSGRSQQVNVNSSLSQSHSIKTGVPQGTILSPLLYILYTADLPTALKYSKFFSYADDIQLLHSGRVNELTGVASELEEDFNQVALWASANLLKLNAKKTEFIAFHSPSMQMQAISLKLGGETVNAKTSVKILGVIFDSTMSFEQRGNYIGKKVTKSEWQEETSSFYLGNVSTSVCIFPAHILLISFGCFGKHCVKICYSCRTMR
jgi:hypothetical protein